MENINLLRKIAMSFSQTTGLEFDDLFQEASLAYLEAMKTHDPSRGKITTHLWYCVENRLKNYLKEEIKHSAFSIDDIEMEKSVLTSPFFENLNKEAQEIAKTILESPKDFIYIPSEEAQIKVTRVMLEKGWSWMKILTGIKNLREIYA
jgi:DNA-directed RNA polymerase specialized sigma subunit